MQALLLPLGSDWYALELTAVREVVPEPAVTPLPGAPPEVLGVFNLRGEVVPVFDTSALLALGPGPEPRYLIVADTPFGPCGLSSEAVPDRTVLGDPAGPAERPGTVGRFAVNGGVATLLDVEDLLAGAPARS